jgi:hypothetical protein
MYSLICYYELIADDKRWVKKMEPHLMVTLCRAVATDSFASWQQKNMDPILMGFLTGSTFTVYETFPGACRFGPQAELDWAEKLVSLDYGQHPQITAIKCPQILVKLKERAREGEGVLMADGIVYMPHGQGGSFHAAPCLRSSLFKDFDAPMCGGDVQGSNKISP